jgi:hypothetical protein
LPTGRDVLAYVRELWDSEITPAVVAEAAVPTVPANLTTAGNQLLTGNTSARRRPGLLESAQVQRMKKFMNFIGEGVE